MRSASAFFIFFISFAAHSCEANPLLGNERTHVIQRRANPTDDCNGIWLRATSGAKNKPVKYANCIAGIKTNGFGGAFYHGSGGHPMSPQTLATTVLPKDGEVNVLIPPPATGDGDLYGCDHIVELQILKSVLNQAGGVCDQAKAMADQTVAQQKIQAIRKIVNSANNLAIVQKDVEEPKTKASEKFALSGLTTIGTSKTHGTDLEFLATIDYLSKTSHKSLQVAADLDAEIENQFPGAPSGVATKWALYISEMKAIGVTVKSHVMAEIKALKQQAAHNAGNTCSPPGSPTRRMLPLLPAYNSISRRETSLERRAGEKGPVRSAARSGPNAPPAPACPLPGQQKTVVPRSQMKIKPAPETKPRMPAHKVAHKPLTPKKVVPRPANRPRRAAGKPAPPRKRTTPKRKPKHVPKPASRPKGKARPRRR